MMALEPYQAVTYQLSSLYLFYVEKSSCFHLSQQQQKRLQEYS